jgi:pyrroloquinoline quinone biosynthesis protein B
MRHQNSLWRDPLGQAIRSLGQGGVDNSINSYQFAVLARVPAGPVRGPRDHRVIAIGQDPSPAEGAAPFHAAAQWARVPCNEQLCVGPMFVRILGSAAGGGLPQWNCNCQNCAAARHEVTRVKPRTQTSVAVSSDGRKWALLNAAPEVREQIAATPALQPGSGEGPRGSPISAVVLTGADVDQVAGLLSLREGQPFAIYASARVLAAVAQNPIFNVLDPALVRRIPVRLDEPFLLDDVRGLSIEAFAVPGKVALWLEDQGSGEDFGTAEGDTIGLKVSEPATGQSFYFIPSCARVDPELAARLRGAPFILFDGTLFSDDEMIAAGLSTKTGARMGHISMSGPEGALVALDGLDIARRIFIHVNNSNPVLRPDSAERAMVEAAGWEIAEDGMEIRL